MARNHRLQNAVLIVRMYDHELAPIKKAAKKAGLSVSVAVRQVLSKWAARRVK